MDEVVTSEGEFLHIQHTMNSASGHKSEGEDEAIYISFKSGQALITPHEVN